MKKIYFSLPVLLFYVMTGCKSDPQSPGFEYMPDMYRSKALDAYTEYNYGENEHNMSARTPVEGTVARGNELYSYANTTEGYEAAGIELKNPIVLNEQILTEGKELYTKFCVHCHGEGGKGDGSVAKNPKWPGPPPAYDSPAILGLPDGKMFHTITHGKGLMGAHSSQLTKEERWKVVHYINKLQGGGPVLSTDSLKTDTIKK